MKLKTNSQKEIAAQFIELVLSGTAKLKEAGELIAQAIDEHGDEIIDVICDQNKDMTPEFIKRLEAVGRKRVHPQLFIGEEPGIRRLRRLPFSIQEKYVTSPVPLLLVEDGATKTLNVDIRNLTPSQALQVFGSDRVRSEAEQRAFIEDQRARQTPVQNNSPFRVVKNELIVMEPCKLTRKELAEILSGMV